MMIARQGRVKPSRKRNIFGDLQNQELNSPLEVVVSQPAPDVALDCAGEGVLVFS